VDYGFREDGESFSGSRRDYQTSFFFVKLTAGQDIFPRKLLQSPNMERTLLFRSLKDRSSV